MKKFDPAHDCPVERRWRNYFVNEISRLGELCIYVDPVTRRMHLRAAIRRKAKRLPPGAIFVGRYVKPHPVSAFIADMHQVMSEVRT